MVSLIVAGHETSALTLTWAFVLLSQHPEIESQLHAQVDGLAEARCDVSADTVRGASLRGEDRRPVGPKVDLDQTFKQLEYVDWLVSETLRLYPTSWVIARESVERCSIGPFGIEPGTVVVMSQWILHRDQRRYDDPECFRPERWAHGLAKRLPRFAYIPYGGGPRMCIGNAFARMEMMLVLATISRRFQLSVAPGQSIVPRPSATLGFVTHPRIRVSSRRATFQPRTLEAHAPELCRTVDAR
jgi:cytochrome P450